jgi:two-component system, OmpR family, phosphate regulon sensor histidine kinase PhoR
MKIPFIHNSLVIFLAIGLIVVSTVALTFVSYYYTVGRENLAETTLVQSNIKLALQYVDRIEQRIVDNDRLLDEMIDVNEPSKWPSMVAAIKEADLNVDQVYFLRSDSNYPIYPPYSHDIRNQWGAFRASFNVRELDVAHLAVGQPHHLHKERPNNYFFATFFLKETRDGERILVCYQMNFDKILDLLDRRLRDLQDKFYVSIVDFENNGIYGQPISRSSKYFFETRFPSTLYKWILQIVPRNYTELELGVKNQRRTSLFLIILSMLLIFFSLAIIYVGWRHDRQLRQLKENFISNVSHELKTPLSLIRMFSELLVMDRVKGDDKRQEYYRIIHSESDRMSRLINNLLDFANLVRGIEHKHFEKINIGQLVTKALEAYRYEVEKSGFHLNVAVAEGIPDSFADPNAITMALFNLLDNSVKYSGERKEIEVRVDRTDGFLNLAVIDKGLGITLSEQEKIFDKFYRGNEPSVRRIRGSGIGLAITKHVAEMHGGEVTVASEPGEGSEFTLRIPIRSAPDDMTNAIRNRKIRNAKKS